MKRFSAVLAAAAIVALSLAACSATQKDSGETYTSDYTYVDAGRTTIVVSNPDSGEPEAHGVETVKNIQFVFKDQYVFGSSVAKITGIEVDDYGIGDVAGYADVEMIDVGSRKDGMKIAYKAYDKDGNVVRDSFVYTVLEKTESTDKVKKGDTVEGRRFDFPAETVRIEFDTYTED